MPLWMDAFVESYFDRVKGICFQVAKAQYLQQLAQRVDDVKFVGIAVSGEEEQKFLAKIFVMPEVRGTKNRNSADDIDYGCIVDSAPADLPEQEYQELLNSVRRKNLLQEQKGWATRDRSAPRIPAQKVINLAQKKAVVLGAPGSGKTMLASYFALMLCETTQSDPTQIGLQANDGYLPVVVRIRDWILQPNMGLLEYLRSNAKASLACKELPTGFFEHWLDRGKALILLDGLDEVVDEAQRRKIAEQIETFLHQYQDNPAIITSRPAGYRWDFFNLDEFPHYTLESFDDKQVATFIDHWYDSRLPNDPAQAERRKADLQKAFSRNERIRLLAKNPLLLTIITLIHRYGGELPKQRYDLYEAAVKTLLIKWASEKEIKRYEQDLIYLKQDDLLYILKKIAYWIHTKGSVGETEGGTIVKKNDLIGQLRKEIQGRKKCEFDEAEEEAKRFIDFIQNRTGLLNEQGRDRYAFVHKTFQEYLTAEEIYYLANREDDTNIILEHFRAHLHDQHWREVLLLLVSRLEGHKARKAIQAILDAKSEYEQWLHRDLLFAGWCLTEDPADLKDVAEDLVGDILDRLVGLEVEKSDRIGSRISYEVEKIIHCFGETTVQQDILAKLKAQKYRIHKFRLLEFRAMLGHKASAISILLYLLGKEKWDVRSRAAIVLGRLGNGESEVVSGLLSMLVERDGVERDGVERIAAASALGKLGHSSEANVTLLTLLSDSETGVRSSAASALGYLGYSSAETIATLLTLLSDSETDVRSSAASALGHLGYSSPEVVNGLLSLLVDRDGAARASAAATLGQLGHSSPEVVSGLLSLLVDPEWLIRARAVSALAQLGKGHSDAIGGVLSLLDDPEWFVRSNALLALVQLGYGSSEVVSRLLSLLDDSKLDLNFTVASAFNQLAKTSTTIIIEVVQWLERNPKHDGIGNAIDCLWSIVVE